MFNIMLVDDETIARKDLKSMLVKAGSGFRIIAEAGDGEEALSKFQQDRPDIVISDIKMPRMDGIQLAQHILAFSKETKIVLLSAYGEFHLARQALQLGVSAYLLKHEIDPPLLLKTLTGLASKIEAESAPVKTSGILKLLQNSLEPMERKAILKKFEGTLQSGSLYLILFQIDEEVPRLHTGHLTPFEVLADIANKHTQDSIPSEFLQTEANEFVYILNIHQVRSSQQQTSMLTQIIKQIQSDFNRQLHTTISAAVGGPVSYLDQITDLYKKTASSLEYRIFTRGEALILNNYSSAADQVDIATHKETLSRFKVELEQGDFHTAKELLKTFLLRDVLAARNIALLQYAIEELLLILRDALSLKRFDASRSFDIYKHNQRINKLGTIFSINDWFETTIDQLFPKKRGYSIKVMKALQYIHTHFKEDISLEEIAAVMNVSVIYASQLFKKEVGENYTSYLTSYRMKKAVELLQSSEYKIYEISEMVGYQSTTYFCRTFKKLMGRSPTEYENGRTK